MKKSDLRTIKNNIKLGNKLFMMSMYIFKSNV